MTTLVIEFKKIESDDAAKYTTFCCNSKAERIINENGIDDVFESIHTAVLSIAGAGGIIDSVLDRTINISKYNSLAGSSYIRLLKELHHPRKSLINIQNINDSE